MNEQKIQEVIFGSRAFVYLWSAEPSMLFCFQIPFEMRTTTLDTQNLKLNHDYQERDI